MQNGDSIIEIFLDPACGTGGFLVIAVARMIGSKASNKRPRRPGFRVDAADQDRQRVTELAVAR
ncbi:MAG TPA: hypothetical protein PLS53_18370 [Thermoanaerobaculaceae bacterium]|nr:hypothetical protein [Thermoanaerobaculaceae bacterium]